MFKKFQAQNYISYFSPLQSNKAGPKEYAKCFSFVSKGCESIGLNGLKQKNFRYLFFFCSPHIK